MPPKQKKPVLNQASLASFLRPKTPRRPTDDEVEKRAASSEASNPKRLKLPTHQAVITSVFVPPGAEPKERTGDDSVWNEYYDEKDFAAYQQNKTAWQRMIRSTAVDPKMMKTFKNYQETT